jgi:hypothetical protein
MDEKDVKSRCEGKRRWEVCSRTKDRKTTYTCGECQKFLCMEHIIPMCEECISASKENNCGYVKVKETLFNKFMQIFLLIIYDL